MGIWGGVLVMICGFFLLYQGAPFRALPARRPRITFWPKYETTLMAPRPAAEWAGALATLGYQPVSRKALDEDGAVTFRRGRLFGDFSLRWLATRVTLVSEGEGGVRLTFCADVLAAFDTGDSWDLMQQLRAALEKKG